jgi:argininosuccinate lyase
MFSGVYLDRVLEPCYLNWKKYLCAISFSIHRAHLIMLAERGILAPEIVRSIKEGIDAIEKEFAFPENIPENTEDLYFVFEKELSRRIGADKAGFLHTARSRNDMDAAAFRLFTRGRITGLLEAVLDLLNALSARINESSGDEPFILYTHGQPANVSTLGHYFMSMLLEITECADLVRLALETVDRSPMGACAITTTGFPIDRDIVSRLLGFNSVIPNSYGAISGSHWLSFPAAALGQLLSDIGRFTADLLHKASCEVGIIDFPDSLVQISSIMPQKRNPVILEHIRIQASLAMGISRGIETLFRNTPFQDINEAGDAALDEFSRAMDTALSCLALFKETISSITVNRAKVEDISRGYGITTTELADSMVRDFGISFREAHGISAAFVKSGCDKDALARAFFDAGFGVLSYTGADIDRILSAENFIAARKVKGGPAPEGMAEQKKEAGRAASGLKSFLAGLSEKRAAAERELSLAWGKL